VHFKHNILDAPVVNLETNKARRADFRKESPLALLLSLIQAEEIVTLSTHGVHTKSVTKEKD